MMVPDTHLVEIILSYGGRVERVLGDGDHDTRPGARLILHQQLHDALRNKHNSGMSVHVSDWEIVTTVKGQISGNENNRI